MLESNSEVWADYYKANEKRDVRPVFTKWTTLHPEKGNNLLAIDLGCGDSTEAIALLENGWRVLAIDKEPEALQRLIDRTPVALRDKLETRQASFEEIDHLPPSAFVYAGFSLPFCTPEYFPTLWNLIVESVQAGGWFAGQLFGVNDEWAQTPTMNFHDADAVNALLAPFEVDQLQEVDRDGITAVNTPKHWHVFHIIAHKLR